MATTSAELKERGLESNGVLMPPKEFDKGDFDECYRYELINGVLIVHPLVEDAVAAANELLGYRLLEYADHHPLGAALKATFFNRIVPVRSDRRWVDRVIWAGPRKHPRRGPTPTIIAEFVSRRRCDQVFDYESKQLDFFKVGVKEYWLIDRFRRKLTVFSQSNGEIKKRVVRENRSYHPELLPGFELPLAELFHCADKYPDDEGEDDS